MSWIKDFKRDFRDTLYTKIFLFIGLASMIFFPGIVYWNYHSDIEDIDKFEATGLKDETITDIFDLASSVGRGQRKTFTVSGHDYNSYPVYLESSENMNQITVGSKISKVANSRQFSVLTGSRVFTFHTSDMRRSRRINMLIFFVMAFVWTSLTVAIAYAREKSTVHNKVNLL